MGLFDNDKIRSIGKETKLFYGRNQTTIEETGVSAVAEIINGWARGTAQRMEEEAKSDGNITKEEQERIEAFKKDKEKLIATITKKYKKEIAQYKQQIHNVINDVELDCKYQKTHDYFVDIVKIIMNDSEKDNPEVIANFTQFIDNEEFIEGHVQALKKKEERLKREEQEELIRLKKEREEKEAQLEKEYQQELREYELELEAYKLQIEQRKSKGFFKKLLSAELPEPPKKPVRRTLE